MEYIKEETVRDYQKVCKVIDSLDDERQIKACLVLIILFMKKHPKFIILSMTLQANLKIKEIWLTPIK